MYRAISGDNDSSLDLFRFFREILPPRCRNVRHFIEDVDLDSIDAVALRKTFEAIEKSQEKPLYGPLAVKELKRLLVCVYGAIC